MVPQNLSPLFGVFSGPQKKNHLPWHGRSQHDRSGSIKWKHRFESLQSNACIQYMHTYIHTCIHTYTHTQIKRINQNPPPYNGQASLHLLCTCLSLFSGEAKPPQNPFHHLSFPLFNIIYCPTLILVEHPSAPSGLVEYFFVFLWFYTIPQGNQVEHALGTPFVEKNSAQTLIFAIVSKDGVPPAFCGTFGKPEK